MNEPAPVPAGSIALQDRMIRLVWAVVVRCQPPRLARRTALRVLREHWQAPEPDDPHGRGVRGRLVTALREELGDVAEQAIREARVVDELTLSARRRPTSPCG